MLASWDEQGPPMTRPLVCLRTISVARASGYQQISVAYARDTAAMDICQYPGHMPRISADIPWEVPKPYP